MAGRGSQTELLVAQVGRGLQLLRPHPGGCGQTEEPQSWSEPAGHCPLQSRPGVQGLAGRLQLYPPPQALIWEVLAPGGSSQDTHPPWSSTKPLGEGTAVGSAFTRLLRVSSTIAFNSLTPPDLTSTSPPPCSPPSSQTGLLVVVHSLSQV